MILTAIIYTIKNDPAVQALVNTRVYGDFVPEDCQKPAIVVYV